MNCHLLIPDLFRAEQGRGLPALAALLGRAARRPLFAADAEEWLCRRFGVQKQRDWPVAPLTAEGDGAPPGNCYWLRADPVHLRVNRDHLVLADSGAFPLSEAEAEALVATLNRHFDGDGLWFRSLRPDRWYLALKEAPRLCTCPLPQAAGANVGACLPAGEDSRYWQRVTNDVQMLLHDHPINEARESAGNLPVNSVWLWGGGARPAVTARPFDSVRSNDALSRSLALRTKIDGDALPGDADEWLDGLGDGNHLAVLNFLRGAAQYRDEQGWQEALNELERRWFAPLREALAERRIASLTFTVPGAPCEFAVSRGDRWKFWRRARSGIGP